MSYPTDGMTHEQKLMTMRGNNPHFAHAATHHELGIAYMIGRRFKEAEEYAKEAGIKPLATIIASPASVTMRAAANFELMPPLPAAVAGTDAGGRGPRVETSGSSVSIETPSIAGCFRSRRRPRAPW